MGCIHTLHFHWRPFLAPFSNASRLTLEQQRRIVNYGRSATDSAQWDSVHQQARRRQVDSENLMEGLPYLRLRGRAPWMQPPSIHSFFEEQFHRSTDKVAEIQAQAQHSCLMKRRRGWIVENTSFGDQWAECPWLPIPSHRRGNHGRRQSGDCLLNNCVVLPLIDDRRTQWWLAIRDLQQSLGLPLSLASLSHATIFSGDMTDVLPSCRCVSSCLGRISRLSRFCLAIFLILGIFQLFANHQQLDLESVPVGVKLAL